MKLLKCSSNRAKEIQTLFDKTFTHSEGASEGKVVGSLAFDLLTTTESSKLLAFIVEDADEIVGCILFSALIFKDNCQAYILSPVAIKTEKQGHGLGKALINFGLEQLKSEGVQFVFTYGDPNFYSKVGFAQVSESIIKAPLPLSYPEGWLVQSLNGEPVESIVGDCVCVEALNNPELW